jgi:hypothetical protein
VVYKNLTIFPLYGKEPQAPADDVLSLDEALKMGVLLVHESASGGDVNTLYLTNLSSRYIFIMAGEVVLGGQQDRCLSSDLMLPPGAKNVPVTVFCVEHGRWTGSAAFKQSAHSVAAPDVRLHALAGGFAVALASVAPAETVAVGGLPASGEAVSGFHGPVGGMIVGRPLAGMAGMGRAPAQRVTRAAMAEMKVSQEQQTVWSHVAGKTRQFGAESESGTYRRVLEMSSTQAHNAIAPYLNAFPMQGTSIDGVVVAVNGKYIAADVFSRHGLFKKLWPKLLRSYAQAAAEAPGSKPNHGVTQADASAFLNRSQAGKQSTVQSRLGVTTQILGGSTVTYRFSGLKHALKKEADPLHTSVITTK